MTICDDDAPTTDRPKSNQPASQSTPTYVSVVVIIIIISGNSSSQPAETIQPLPPRIPFSNSTFPLSLCCSVSEQQLHFVAPIHRTRPQFQLPTTHPPLNDSHRLSGTVPEETRTEQRTDRSAKCAQIFLSSPPPNFFSRNVWITISSQVPSLRHQAMEIPELKCIVGHCIE